MHILDHIKRICFEQSALLYPSADLTRAIFTLNSDPKRIDFGDISSNLPLVIAPTTSERARDIAEKIKNSINDPMIASIKIAGAGFLNITLTTEAYAQICFGLSKDLQAMLIPERDGDLTYNIEYVSANPTGPLHMGHGRGGIIGDTLARILSIIGYKVTREFYINDAGAQIQKLGESLKARYLQELGETVSLPEDGYQGEYLRELAAEIVTLYGATLRNSPVPFFADYGKKALLAALQKTLASYGVLFDTWFSEQQLYADGSVENILSKFKADGHLYEQDGALWFASTAFGDDKDRVVRKASGELTYVAADIAYLENKLKRGADRLVMVLGQDHHGYISRLKAALAALGKDPQILDAILYQLVTIRENGELVRLSKRAGKIVSLSDVIDAVGTDVARFFYLNRKADAQLDFDLSLALKKTDENPVYYIQYAYVRTHSMLEKGATLALFPSNEHFNELGSAEHLLIRKILSLRELLDSIRITYQVHLLSYYVIELACLFHHYYAVNRVIDPQLPDRSSARLLVVSYVRDTLALCLKLLGLENPTSM